MSSLELMSFVIAVLNLLVATAAWVFVGQEYDALRRTLGTVFFASGLAFGAVGFYANLSPQLLTPGLPPVETETVVNSPSSTSTNTPSPTHTPTSIPTHTPTPKPTKTPAPPTNTRVPPTAKPTLTNTPIPSTKTPTPHYTPTVPSDMGTIILQGSSQLAGLGTQMQWVDELGRWHNVDNWRGQLDTTGRISWLVYPKDFNTGPFRWVVYNRDGSIRFESQPFHLPSTGQGYLTSVE